jgi:RNA recognition motif-containing protein
MGRKIYVGNLPYTATESEVTTKFSEFGTVESIKLITDRDTGHGKGFGFVEMASDSEANAAIGRLNGTDYGGRPMKVNEARPPDDKGGRRSGGSSGYGRRW